MDHHQWIHGSTRIHASTTDPCITTKRIHETTDPPTGSTDPRIHSRSTEDPQIHGSAGGALLLPCVKRSTIRTSTPSRHHRQAPHGTTQSIVVRLDAMIYLVQYRMAHLSPYTTRHAHLYMLYFFIIYWYRFTIFYPEWLRGDTPTSCSDIGDRGHGTGCMIRNPYPRIWRRLFLSRVLLFLI